MIMSFVQLITTLVFALALSGIDPSACQTVKGKVSCNDCAQDYDFSGIKVSVKCDQGMKNLVVETTEDDGSFKVDLSSDHEKPAPMNCLVKLLGGPTQLYASRKNQISQIVTGKEENSYTISTPLTFFKSCPQYSQCKKAANPIGSSKTINLPVPPEWGLAPTSFYLPFFPIIGIP